uniref:Uncharacterized protein n=1 Tax=Romanomermis culicivorax TaxID=13658 RepID=A0A915INH9_ROMCU
MEKTFIEEKQRKKVKERQEKNAQEDQKYKPNLFEFDQNSGFWTYKYAE